MRKLKALCFAAMVFYSTVAYAAPQNIEADGEYFMSTYGLPIILSQLSYLFMEIDTYTIFC